MARNQILTFNQTALANDAAISGQSSGVVLSFIAEEDLSTGNIIAVKQLELITTDGFWVLYLDNKPPKKSARFFN